MSNYNKQKAFEVSKYYEEVDKIQKRIVIVDGIEYIANDTKDNIMNRIHKVSVVVQLYEKVSKFFLPHMMLSTCGKRVGEYNFSESKWMSGGPIIKKEPLKVEWIKGDVSKFDIVEIDDKEYYVDIYNNIIDKDTLEVIGKITEDGDAIFNED